MRIGVCTTDFETVPADLLFKKIKNHGFKVTQFSFVSISESNFVPNGEIEIAKNIDKSVVELVKKTSEKYNIPIVGVNGTFNMAHPDKNVREDGLARLEGLCIAANGLECDVITLCSGTRNTNDLWTAHIDNGTQAAWDDMMDCMKKAVKIAEKYNITLIVETEAANIIDTPEKAKKMMDEVGSENLKMIMDCANLFHIGKAKRENVDEIITHAFEIFGKDTLIAHGKDISESDGIDFCATGYGIINYPLFIDLLKKYGYKNDFILHGIYDENKMQKGIETVINLL